ncbi:hypothetical protein RHGRI_037111 [Rhododendron griersonianum]|uniref:Uncharacterized protein n=1 Tax=Rhododendron griersonianum TaxID=479676 RepID=A0AAV6HTS3_9ERIC|nr:hypothetical protein RHGRI_037111 [Rhododendron griersonianum]
MQASQEYQSSGGIHRLYHHPMQPVEPYCFSSFQILDDDISTDNVSPSFVQATQVGDEQYYTLDSSPATSYTVCGTPSAFSISSNLTPFSPQGSQSYLTDQHHSYDNTYGSPLSGSSIVDEGSELRQMLRVLELQLLGPESDIDDSCSQITTETVPRLDLRQALISCASAVADEDFLTAERFINVLERMVSVSGEPIQRLGAYMLEALRARFFLTGSCIYKKLKCKEPTSSELMSYMHVLYQICPYYKFAYNSANVVIWEAMQNENRIHIIDFQIAQGSQWVSLIEVLAKHPGGAPQVRITGVDDSQSAHARSGGLELVGKRLSKVAEQCGVRFEFHGAGISGCEVNLENLMLRPGEAVAVNFPYMLHHMPDESVTTTNHRDRLLRLVKSLSPKVVILVEQESNTNTASFFPRFKETLEYYTAMFESIDAGRPRDDKQRMSAEEHCVARDIVNIIACEGPERVERHELFGKWRARLVMAGFSQCPLSPSVSMAIMDVLKDYSKNYRLQEREGALHLFWNNRVLVTSSAWR